MDVENLLFYNKTTCPVRFQNIFSKILRKISYRDSEILIFFLLLLLFFFGGGGGIIFP